MRARGQRLFAILLIGIGGIMLTANFIEIDSSEIFWPLVLILIGIWFIFRPGLSQYGEVVRLKIIGEINRDGDWELKDEEILMFVGELDFDLTEAEIPLGETSLRILAFVSELDLRLPEGVGLSLSVNAFVSNAGIYEPKQEYIFSGMNYTSDDYASAERKIRVVISSFVAEVKVR
ncbi:MAG: hypothetical protein FVQ83_16500 [Chloroflexi bacterium]|nr:hypothetical protein [Chloroflexota bacterium]